MPLPFVLLAVLLVPASDAGLRPSWSLSLAAWAEAGGLRSVHAGRDLVLAEDAEHAVTAVDAATGAFRWVVRLDGPLAHPPTAGGGTWTFATATRALVVDAASGARRLDLPLAAESAAAPVSDGERLYEASVQGDAFRAWRLADGRLAWRTRLPGGASGRLEVVGAGDDALVVATCGDGTLRAFPGTDAVPRGPAWVARVGRPVGPVLAVEERLIVVDAAGAVVAVDARSGAVAWRTVLGEAPVGGGVAAGGRVVVGTTAGLRAYRASTGEEVWRTDDGAERPLAAVPGVVVTRRATGRLLARVGDDARAEEARIDPGLLSTGDRLVDWDPAGALRTAVPSAPERPAVH